MSEVRDGTDSSLYRSPKDVKGFTSHPRNLIGHHLGSKSLPIKVKKKIFMMDESGLSEEYFVGDILCCHGCISQELNRT